MKLNIFKINVATLSLTALIVSTLSCKKIDELLTFEISNVSNITINATSPVNLPLNIASPDVTTNSSQQFQNNNTSDNHIKDIRLKDLQLSISSPSSQTFAFLKSVHIYISTNASNEIELASLENISSSAKTIVLNPTQVKLDDYVKAASYKLRSTIVTQQVLTQNVEIKIDSKFKVTATL
jgi:hypothetical protein